MEVRAVAGLERPRDATSSVGYAGPSVGFRVAEDLENRRAVGGAQVREVLARVGARQHRRSGAA